MDKLLIFYLTNNDRYFVFDKFKKELENSKYKNDIKFLIVNSNQDSSYYENQLKITDINYDISFIDCPQSNYLPKVRFAIEYAKTNNYKYILKYDSDVLMPKYTLDFIFENLNKLNDKNNLTIGPSMSTGIPSIEFFIDDFFEEKDAKEIREEFKKCVFHIQPSIMDYTFLNKCSINNQNNWDGEDYYNTLNNYMDNLDTDINGRGYNNYCKFYRGIHPIRHGFGNDLLNKLIVKNKEKFFLEKKCSFFENNNCKQLVAMCFVILTENYDKIINLENLTIDGCDEVPINRFAWNNNLKHLIIKSGYAIHITYNWRWFLNNVDGGSNIDKPTINLQEYEENFIKKLYNNDTD